MKKNHLFSIFLMVSCVVILVLAYLIGEMYGNARVINYSGIVRGAIQKLVKEELCDAPTDDLIVYIDEIIFDLQTGDGVHSLKKERDEEYQAQLEVVDNTWITLKDTITQHRDDADYEEQLYALSELQYTQAAELVGIAERVSSARIVQFIAFFYSSVAVAGVVIFLTERQIRKKLEASLITDSLTGTLIPRVFVTQAYELVQKNPKETYVVVAFDIKNFKSINMNYGYNYADTFLYKIVNELGTNHAPKFLVSHITADVFFSLTKWQEDIEDVLLSTFDDAVKNAQRKLGLQTMDINFRFGGCVVDKSPEAVELAMDHAHRAHKIASVEKRDFVWCNDQLLEQLNREMYIEKNFFRALTQNQFQMYLQPQMNLHTGIVDSAECLVRWKLDDGTLLFPDLFIPFLEQKKFITELDYHMLEQVCAFQSERQNAGYELYTVAANFSRVTLNNPEFYRKVLDIVGQYHIPYERIGIEIVETALNNMSEQTLEQLTALKNMGFRVAVDDFGSGYSNLSELCDLPIQVLKLDKEFLWRVKENDKLHDIIMSIIDMAHKIGLRVICEGAETQEHVDYLCAVKCDCVQGYFYSKPIPKEEYHW